MLGTKTEFISSLSVANFRFVLYQELMDADAIILQFRATTTQRRLNTTMFQLNAHIAVICVFLKALRFMTK